jgi:ComF family protein
MMAIAQYSKTLSSILADFIALFFPDHCLGCNEILVKGEDLLCIRCIIDLPRTDYHLYETNHIKERLSARIAIENVYVFLKFNKKGTVQQLLHQLKYNSRPEIGVALGKIYGKQLLAVNSLVDYDLLIPVPLHKSRLRKRGYNQSAKFAEGLSQVLGISVNENALIRRSPTVSQTKKSRMERWQNVKSAFSVIEAPLLRNRSIVLIDDVITTGATIEAIAKPLLYAGCKKIAVICIAEA